MSQQQNNSPKPLRYIVLDSCIFNHLGIPDLQQQIFNILGDALQKGYGLSISKFTIFELLDTATIDDELKVLHAINGIRHFNVNKEVLIAASHLGCIYKEDNVLKEPDKGDKIIGATAVLHNSLIFTTNGRDFPAPFFNPVAKPLLTYKKPDGREVFIVGYFLEPDLPIIGLKHKERIDEHKRKFRKKRP